MSQGGDPDLEQALAASLQTFRLEQFKRELVNRPSPTSLGTEMQPGSSARKGRLERSASVSEEGGVVTTEVRPRSRPEGRKWAGPDSLPPPPLEKRRGSTVGLGGPRMEKEQDLISFLSPNPDKHRHTLDDLAALDLPFNNNRKQQQQQSDKIMSVKSLMRESPVGGSGGRGGSPAHSFGGFVSGPRAELYASPPVHSLPPLPPQFQQHGSRPAAAGPYYQFNQNVLPYPQSLGMMGGQAQSLSRTALMQTMLNTNQTFSPAYSPTNQTPTQDSFSSPTFNSIVKSQSWSDGDPSTSTPKGALTRPAPQGRALSIQGLISPPPPPPPSIRSSISGHSLDSSRPGSGRKITPKADNESLIDLDVGETTTVSVLDEFDPLIHTPQEEDIYWSSRESTSNYSESFYDSYDPFSYMADRAEILEQQSIDELDSSDVPNLPPKLKKIGVVRPLPEVSEAKLSRRKTVARNYENIVKKDATFFQRIGVNKTASVARDSEVLAFTQMVRDIRATANAQDVKTNPGLVVGARLSATYPEGTELKLVVSHRINNQDSCAPVQFTASVLSDLAQIIAKVLIELDQDIDDCGSYFLQVYGRGEYLEAGSLDEFQYVHHCYKYDRDVRLTLVHRDDISRDLARTELDDQQDCELSYDQISPLDRANTLSHEDLQTLLEFLQREAERINNTANTLVTCSEKNVIQSLNPKGMLQAVKAVCSKLGGVETVDLADALDRFSQACVKFDCDKGNEDPAGRLRPEIVEVVGERYAMVTLNRVKKEGFQNSKEEIKASLKLITEKVYSLIRTYSRTFRVDFSLEEIDALSPGELKDSTTVQESLLVRVGCLHRLDLGWEFTDYKVDVRVYHGTRLIRETQSTTFQMAEHSHQRLHKMVTFNSWIDIKTLSVANIPLEARLVLCLVGRGRDPENKDNTVLTELGWTAIQLYSLERNLSQGPFLLAVWPMEVSQQIGPAPDSSSHPKADTCPLLGLELLDLGGPVTYPRLQSAQPVKSPEATIDELDVKTREQLESMCEQDILSFHNRPTQDREILWEKRFYLRCTAGALPKVLMSVRSWDPETLADLHALVQSWPRPDIADTLQLLLPIFPDVEVRKKAVEWLKEETNDTILDILPQLMEAMKHETWIVSDLVRFLLWRCLCSPLVAHSLYWLLHQSLPGVSPQNSDGGGSDERLGIGLARHKRRLQLILRTLFVISGDNLRNRFLAQQMLMQELYHAADAIKSSKDSNRQTTLARHMENLHHQLRTTPTLLPLSASLTAKGVDVKNCLYFNSNTFPLKVVFNSAEDHGGLIQIIYKVGDDLRQDMLTLQMIRVMDRLWLKNSLDLRIVLFSCVPTGFKSGILEFVEDAKTLREIQVAEDGVTGTFRSETLNDWLQKHNPSQLEFKRAVSNFTRSCAGYSVVTYVLGICDRHNDNIMLKTSGHLFHIDFGKFLGDAQKFGSIKRDRVPFVLTPDMAYVINGGKGSTERFHTFVDLCCKAFNVLRREGNLILTLFALMASSGIPGVSKEAVKYVQERLLLDLSEEEASARFSQLISESMSSFSTQLNFFVHNLAQLKFGKGGTSDHSLSFIPNKYSMASDGKIKDVVVHGIQKRYDTEKHYLFILKLTRHGIKDPVYVFRTYKQFCEFHSRLCTEYPLTKFHSIPSGYSLGRSNIREVAERRKREIGTFLSSLFLLAEEISHSDLVYTFFHPLLKDEEETNIHIHKLKETRGHVRKPSVGKIRGRMKLKIYYRNETLHVLIQFVENLSVNDAREEPNSYVKVYLHPDPNKLTKRKTKVVRRSCNPTFMEMLEYRTPLDIVRCRTLQATVWDSSQFQENMFLGCVTVPLDDPALSTNEGIEQWFSLGQFFR